MSDHKLEKEGDELDRLFQSTLFGCGLQKSVKMSLLGLLLDHFVACSTNKLSDKP